jgi:uncharacterized integral membrane protein
MESPGSLTTPTKVEERAHRKRTVRERSRLTAVAVLAAVATAFALLNFHHVRVNFIVTTAHPPLIVVIVACLAVGLVLGLLGGRHAANRKAPPL